MEQKINHVWCDPEKMELKALQDLQRGTLEQLGRTHHDLIILTREIGKRIIPEVQDGAQN